MSDWISVKDRMPADDGDELVLVFIDANDARINGMAVAGYDLGRNVAGTWYLSTDSPTTLTITHWQPLPAPPQTIPTESSE